MKIKEVRLYWIRIPFKEPFHHSLAQRHAAENIVVQIETKEGVFGFGESVPRDYVTGEDCESVLTHLKEHWIPSLWGKEWSSKEEFLPFLSQWGKGVSSSSGISEKRMHAARCAIELALLDAAGIVFGCSATTLLGWNCTGKDVFYSGVISGGSLDKATRKASLMRLFGFKFIKLKVGDEGDFSKIKNVRAKLGPKIDLRLDANGAWSAKQALKKIETFKSFNISAIEQPVPKEDLAGMKQVTQESGVPIVADESLISLEDARFLLDEKGCDILNIRLSKCGGMFYAHEMAQLALKAELGFQLGCQVGETAILSSAGRLFAQSHPETLYLEGSYEKFLLKEDISKNRVSFTYGGRGKAIKGNGLGVSIDISALARLSQTQLILKERVRPL